MYFGLFLATGVFFIFMAFALFLPVIVLLPQKFAICFTLGCGFIVGSFFALRGPKNQFLHMSSKERLPFTLGFIGSMMGTIYVSRVLHSYVHSVMFFCDSGFGSSILRYLLLPQRIYMTEVHNIFFNLDSIKMLRQVMVT